MTRNIKKVPKKERPREKLRKKGAPSLSDLELIAIILGSGIKGKNVLSVAKSLLAEMDKSGTETDYEKLLTLPGIGPSKACLIMASMEFSRRRIRPEGIRIIKPRDILPLISHLSDRKQEHLVCVSLNGANEVNSVRIVSIGTIDRTLVHPREVFSGPITDRAASIIIAHNHPDGSLQPGAKDIKVTKSLIKAGEILGIPLQDHIIFSTKGFYSFMENGRI